MAEHGQGRQGRWVVGGGAFTMEVAKWQSMVKLGRAGGWWGAGGAGPVTRPVEVAKR